MPLVSTRRLVAVLLAVTLAMTGVAAPVAAGPQAAETGDQHRCDDHRQGDDSGCSERGDEEPDFALEIRLAQGPVAGFFDMECFGSPLDHECDKDGGLSGGPVAVDYSGNNSADYLNGTGGGGDTITVTAGDQSGSVSFDCTFTRATVTNGTACDGGADTSGGHAAPA